MDQQVLVYQLRHLLQMTTLNASEAGLRALIQRIFASHQRPIWTATKLTFSWCSISPSARPPKIYHKQIELEDAARL